VTATLRQSDPQALVVGYYPSPNESECAVDAGTVLSNQRSLSETARELRVDEIVVALTERRAGSMPLRELLDCKLVRHEGLRRQYAFREDSGPDPAGLRERGLDGLRRRVQPGPVRAPRSSGCSTC
jgi:hypothetical protein